MKKWILASCLILAATAAWSAGPEKALKQSKQPADVCAGACEDGSKAQPVTIGFIGPMTGPYRQVGKEAAQVLRLLVADVNAKGGVLGRPVAVLYADDGDDPGKAVRAGKAMIGRGIVAAVGSLQSGVTAALQGVFNDAKIVHVSYGSTAPSLTEKGYRYFFRTCPQDNEQAKVVAGRIRKAGVKKAAILHDGSLYGRELADRIGKRLFDYMIDVVYQGGLSPGQADYAPELAKIRAKGPELLFYAGYYPEAAALLKSRQRLQWDAVFVGGDGTDNPELVRLAGRKAAEGFYFIGPPAPSDLKSPRAKQFLARYREAYGEDLTSIHALFAGDAFLAVVAAIEKTGATEAEKVADYLHRTYVNPAGLTGNLYFDYRGDVVGDLQAIYRIDAEGRSVLQTIILHGAAGK